MMVSKRINSEDMGHYVELWVITLINGSQWLINIIQYLSMVNGGTGDGWLRMVDIGYCWLIMVQSMAND